MFNPPKLTQLQKLPVKSGNRISKDPAKKHALPVTQVHPSRTRDRVRTYDSAASGAKGTAIHVRDEYGSIIGDKGILRTVGTLPTPPLAPELPRGHFVMNITTNASPTIFNATADSAHSLHLESLWVVNWQVTADIADPDLAAPPVGPLVLEVKGDTIQTFNHVFSNIRGLGNRVYLPWNRNGADLYTSMNDHSEPILIYRWKHGDGTLKDVRIQLQSVAGTPLTFTNAFITFAYTVSSWAK